MVSQSQHHQLPYDGVVDAAQTIVDFVNTLDVETGEDTLDHADLRRFREALRAELLAHHDGRSDNDAGRAIEAVVADYPLALRVDGTMRLRSRRRGAGEVVASVVDAMLTLVHEQRWHRVRVCPADDCLEAFYDSSRGGTRRWCSMGVCGNRAKVTTYRERNADSPAAGTAS